MQRNPGSTATEPRPLRSFDFEAVGTDGGIERGAIMSPSEAEAVERLRRDGRRLLAIEPTSRSLFRREIHLSLLGPRVKRLDLAVMVRQFATMVGAGIPLVRCLRVLADQTDHPVLGATLSELHTSVSAGVSLSEAMAHHPSVFDELFVAMVRSGEASGAMDVILLQLADMLERSVGMNNKIRSAMTYPVVVVGLVVVVVIAMLVLVVPQFTGIYDDLGGELPLPTRILLSVSSGLTRHLPVVGAIVLVGGAWLRRWVASSAGRLRWDGLKLRLPLVGGLIHKASMARIGRTLAVLTRSGVPVLDALEITANTAGNRAVADALDDTIEGVRSGETMAANLGRHRVFPAMVVQLVTVGEETGSLAQMMDVVGRTYEEEVEASVSGFASVIEPLLMALIGIVVGGMVIALYLPMFRIIDLVQ